MKYPVITFIMSIVLSAAVCPLRAVTVSDTAYRVQVFTTYSNPTLATTHYGMVFDNQNNLYVAHTSGHIYKITPDGTASVFASNVGYARDIVWAGGTSYGNAFYVTDHNSDMIYRIDRNGSVLPFSSIYSEPVALELDRTGRYGGLLFNGMNIHDRIERILPDGRVSLFSNFPYNNTGGVIGLAFDPGTIYGGLLYAGIFSNSASAYRGVYSMNTYGSPTKFSKNLATALQIEFDTYGAFNGSMYLTGQDTLGGPIRLWKMDETGIATLFADTSVWQLGAFCFGPDGAMYVSEFDYNGRVNTISRITPIPEPLSGSLLLLGGCFVALKQKTPSMR